MTAARAQCRF